MDLIERRRMSSGSIRPTPASLPISAVKEKKHRTP
jgi:hypothetical protein